MIGVDAPVSAPGVPPLLDVHVAVNDVIGLPLSFGVVKLTSMLASCRATAMIVGGPGTPTVSAADAFESALVPTAFVAVTEHEYTSPLLNPPTVTGDAAPVWLPDAPPLFDVHVAVNDVIVLPLLLRGTKLTTADPSPLLTVPIFGGSGTVAGIAVPEGADAGPVPTPLVAVAVQV